MAKDLAIILSNGSINSAVAATLGAQRYRTVMMNVATSPEVGRSTRGAYDQQVAHFKPYREHTIQMPWLTALAKEAAPGAHDPRMRAAIGPQLMELLPLVAVAARYAAHYQAAAVYLGLRVGPGVDELAQAAEWLSIWNEMIQMPCGQAEIEIQAPLLELEPWQVVDLGYQVSAPLEKTWSCIDETANPCGACRGCRNREAWFVQAGKPDPAKPKAK
jgi:hypothetical protein